MVECCLCGQEIGKWGDYDAALKHAEEYHFEIFDSFPSDEVREMVWKKGVFNKYIKNGLIKKEE